MKKRFLSALMVSMITLLAVGCTPAEEDDKVEGNESESVSLEFFQQKFEIIELYDELIAEFEEQNPGVTIEQVSPPDSTTVLISRLATNDLPDMIGLWPAEVLYKDMMDQGLLLDMTGEEFLNRIDKTTLELSNHNGKSYALPTTLSTYGIFCNMDIFNEHKLEVPKTYDDLITVAKTLKEKGVQPFVFKDKSASRLAQECERLSSVINSDITSVMNKVNKGETSFTIEDDMRVLGETVLEIREYGQKDTLGTGEDQANNDFLTGKAAMIIDGSWFMAQINKVNSDMNIELIPFPNPTGEETVVPTNIDVAYSISKDLTEAETKVALKFMDFISSDEIAQRFADTEGGLSIVNSVTNNIKQTESISAIIKEGKQVLTPSNYWHTGLRNAWEAPLQELVMTKDVDLFVENTDNICKEFTNP